MKMLRKIISSPRVEPVSLNEIYEHTHSGVEHEVYLAGLITRARARFEQRTGRLLVQQTWQTSLPMFTNIIELPFAPLQSVTSIQYLNTQGRYQTLESNEYRVVEHGITATITPKLGGCWPTVGYKTMDAIRIEAVYGHAPIVNNQVDVANIIDRDKYELAKQAIFILVSDWFRNREDTAPIQLYEIPNAFKAICTELSVDVL